VVFLNSKHVRDIAIVGHKGRIIGSYDLPEDYGKKHVSVVAVAYRFFQRYRWLTGHGAVFRPYALRTGKKPWKRVEGECAEHYCGKREES